MICVMLLIIIRNKVKGCFMRFYGKKAFTLIELLIVIVIIMILVSMMLGLASFAKNASRRAKASAEIQQIKNALVEYKMKKGAYPECPGGDLTTITNNALTASITNDLPGSINFLDPWDTPYRYKYDSSQPEMYSVWSYGPDGESSSADTKTDDIIE